MLYNGEKIVIGLNRKPLIMLIFIIFIGLLTLMSYANAIITFHSPLISQYVPQPPTSSDGEGSGVWAIPGETIIAAVVLFFIAILFIGMLKGWFS